MSATSPVPVSVQPLALFTSREGSCFLIQSTYRGVSCCPQPSLNGTHITIDGWFHRASIMPLELQGELLASRQHRGCRRRACLARPASPSCRTSNTTGRARP